MIEAQRPFELYRDRIITSDPAVEARRAEFEENFSELEEAGIARDDLYLAWDFTVASERNLSERALSIRDDAFAELGDTDLADLEVQGTRPTVQITGVTNYEPCGRTTAARVQGRLADLRGAAAPDRSRRPADRRRPLSGRPRRSSRASSATRPRTTGSSARSKGQVVVPCYTNLPGCQTGSQFAYSGPTDTIPDRLPDNATLANFTCVIPRSAVEGPNAGPVKPSLYGHGLPGRRRRGRAAATSRDGLRARLHVLRHATGPASRRRTCRRSRLILQDLNNFPKLVDRSQQGFVNFMFLGRAMIHPQWLLVGPAFQFNGAVDHRHPAPLLRRQQPGRHPRAAASSRSRRTSTAASWAFPGMNYSTLLRRSVDFAPYAEGEFVDGLPTPRPASTTTTRPSSSARSSSASCRCSGTAARRTATRTTCRRDPLANTPPHEVLMQVAFGDHQVSMWTADVAARTIGAATNPTPLDPGRHPDVVPLFGIPRIPSFPYSGSALIYVDAGTPAPPITNTPPEGDEFGDDPHGVPAERSRGAGPEGRVPQPERHGHRHLRRRPLLRRRLHRARPRHRLRARSTGVLAGKRAEIAPRSHPALTLRTCAVMRAEGA